MMLSMIFIASCISSGPAGEQKDTRLKDGEEIFSKLYPDISENEKTDTTLIMDGVPLRNFTKFFSDFLKFDYVVDNAVTGNVNLNVKSKKSRRELWNLFVNTIWSSGAYCTLKEKTVYILPIEKK